MKNTAKFIFALSLLVFLGTACGTTTGASSSGMDYSNLQSLDQILRMQPGLQVQGTGGNVTVYVRGISTITLNTQPLYVIDGQSIGTSYNLANNAVNIRDIVSVRVLKGKSETTIYGELGTNGVIIIKTKLSGQ